MTEPDTIDRASGQRADSTTTVRPPSHRWAGRASGLSPGIELLLLLYGLGLIALFLAGIHGVSNPGFPLGGPEDYTIFYTAGRILSLGQNARLYDLSFQSQVQQAILKPYGLSARGAVLPYNYPPFFATLFVPLSKLPLPTSFASWYVINVAFVLLGLGVFARTFETGSVARKLLALVLVLSFLPAQATLARGQSSLLLFLFLALFFLALRQDHDFLAGVALALATFKPQLSLPFVLVLIVMRRWRALLAFGFTAAGLFLVSWLLVGSQGLLSYLDVIRYSATWDGLPGFYPEIMPNLRGTVYRLAAWLEVQPALRLSVPMLSAMVAMLTIGSLLALVLMWRRPIPSPSSRFDVTFAATLALVLFISPHLYNHDLAILVIAGFLFINSRPRPALPRMGYGLAAAGHALPWLGFLLLAPPLQAQSLALLLVAIAAAPYLLRSQRNRSDLSWEELPNEPGAN